MPVMTNRGTILSLPDGVAKVLEEHVSGEIAQIPAETTSSPDLIPAKVEQAKEVAEEKMRGQSLADMGMMPQCPDCGDNLVLQEGCMACKSCGFSRCG